MTARTQTAICDLKGWTLFIAALNDELPEPIFAAEEAKSALIAKTQDLIGLLAPGDFEQFVDLIFVRNGTLRTGDLGGAQTFADFEVLWPLTGETVAVQVKSQADQKTLDRYVAEFAGRPEDWLFFVYHAAPTALMTDSPCVTIVGPDRLSEMAVQAGLVDWLVERQARAIRPAVTRATGLLRLCA